MNKSREMSYSNFVSMFGMTEMECGIADIVNKSMWDGCLLANVRFVESDLKSDSDAFRELKEHGWLVSTHDKYRLSKSAVRRVHERYPNL